jgi:hypothetical protein
MASNSSLHVDLQIAAIGKRRTMTIFAQIYRFKLKKK